MGLQQIPSKGGIPSGNTSGRPGSPVIGDTYYNGQLGVLEIYDGTNWIFNSAPAAKPTIATPTDASSADVYTSTAGKLSVVFTPNTDGGLPLQYNAYTTSGGHSAFSSTSTVTLTGLTPGTAYTVYGTAQNAFGTSINTANATAVTPSTLPQAPTIGTLANPVTGTTLTLSFTAGSAAGKTITNYKYSLDGTTYTAFSPAQTTSPLTISGLTTGTSYTVRIKAVTSNGDSPASDASNAATPTTTVATNYLVIAGGGGGGRRGGGGGAGGYRTSAGTSGGGASAESALNLSLNTNYTVTVGAGGAGSTSTTNKGVNGSNSVFSTITSTGGGGGGSDANTTGATGGSGGGGSNTAGGAKGLGTANQGYDGGNCGPSNGNIEGGGGGAGAVGGTGGAATTGPSGSGGTGVSSTITGTAVTRAGGGGGGGPIYINIVPGGAGTGGGGAGGASGAGDNGVANTGGGAGGSGETNGGSGGSGVVILRWITGPTITVGAGLTADATGTDGIHSYKVFTAGSGNVSFA